MPAHPSSRFISWAAGILLTALLASLTATAQRPGQQRQQQQGQAQFQLPPEVAHRKVDIWSEGARMSGDLYYPKDMPAGAKLPAIVMSHGWGGTKAGLARYAAKFVPAEFIVLAVDYRGWGESDSRTIRYTVTSSIRYTVTSSIRRATWR